MPAPLPRRTPGSGERHRAHSPPPPEGSRPAAAAAARGSPSSRPLSPEARPSPRQHLWPRSTAPGGERRKKETTPPRQRPPCAARLAWHRLTLRACAALGRLAHALYGGAVSIAAEINRQGAARGLARCAVECLSARRPAPRLARHERAGGRGARLPEVRDQEAPGQGGECPGGPWELGEPGGGVQRCPAGRPGGAFVCGLPVPAAGR